MNDYFSKTNDFNYLYKAFNMNYTRDDLFQVQATTNQTRNCTYHLIRFMVKNGVKDFEVRLRRMGRNIARTIYNYWKPIDSVNISNVKNVISTIYHKILNSSVGIEISETNQTIVIKDNKCALCRYHYEDINISGCEILIGFIAEFINLISKESKDSSALFLTPLNVLESRSFGNQSCVIGLQYKIGGN